MAINKKLGLCTIEEIEEYLNKKGYSIIEIEELDDLQDKLFNHPG